MQKLLLKVSDVSLYQPNTQRIHLNTEKTWYYKIA